MAYLQWIHSTRSQQLFWRKGWENPSASLQRWRWRPTAAGCQNAGNDTSGVWLTSGTQLLGGCVPRSQGGCAASKCEVTVTGTPAPRHDVGPWGPSGWRPPEGHGMLQRGRQRVRMESAPSTSPEGLLCQPTPLPTLFIQLWKLPG